MSLENAKWIDVTEKYAKQEKHSDDLCDWYPGCNSKAKFRVTLIDGNKRHLCKRHLPQKLEACDYTHTKVEELSK
jgi:hypothetical protein